MKIADQLKICGEAEEAHKKIVINEMTAREIRGYGIVSDENLDAIRDLIVFARTKYPEALRLVEVLREALMAHNRANDYMKEYGRQIDAQEDVEAGFVHAYSLNAKALAAIEEFEKESGE